VTPVPARAVYSIQRYTTASWKKWASNLPRPIPANTNLFI